MHIDIDHAGMLMFKCRFLTMSNGDLQMVREVTHDMSHCDGLRLRLSPLRLSLSLSPLTP